MKVKCSYCETELNRKPADKKRYKNLFCNRYCRDKFKIKKVKVKCANCNKEIEKSPRDIKKSESGNLFCNKSCFATFNNYNKKRNYKNGEFSYRELAFRSLPKKCNRCGYKKYTSILEVHHKDHNRENNIINNLEILCPNCHSIEHIEKYKGNNKKPL